MFDTEKVGKCLRDDTMMFKCIGQDDLVRRLEGV